MSTGVDARAARVDVRAGRRAARLERLGERAAWIYTALVFVFLFLPIVIVVIYSFNAGRNVNQLTGFSTQWYGSAWSDRFLMNALRNSLTIAATTAVLATVLGTASALAMDRLRPRLRRLFELLTYIAIIVPGIVIGIATLIFLVTAFDWLNPWLAYLGGPDAPELGLGTASIIAAHTLFTMAIVNVLVRTRMRGMDRTLIEASEDLYAPPLRTFVPGHASRSSCRRSWPGHCWRSRSASTTSSSRSSRAARTRRCRSTCSPRSGAGSRPR